MRDTNRTHREALIRILLRAAGLGAVATSAGAACGGVVVVDASSDGAGGGGSGGSGPGGGDDVAVNTGPSSAASTGPSSTASTGPGSTVSVGTTGATSGSSGAGGGSFACSPALQAGEELEYACLALPPSGCLDKASDEVREQMKQALAHLGCGGFSVKDVPCGPDPGVSSACCYFAQGFTLECGGRPFTIDGRARVAAAIRRSDWRAAHAARAAHAIDIASITDEDRRALADGWTKDALDEHASVASFARFVLDLLAVGAPAELVALAQRAMGDEIRHAELCFGLASRYAGVDVGPSELPSHGALERRSPAEIAAAAVREGCVGETLAALTAAAARDAATDDDVRGALDTIARDEAEHAALAWRFVAWMLTDADAAVTSAIERAFAEACAPARAGTFPEDDDERLASHGRLSANARRALARDALAEVVAPCARVLLTAFGTHRAALDPRREAATTA